MADLLQYTRRLQKLLYKKEKNNKIRSDSLLLILTESDISGAIATIGEISNVIFPIQLVKSAKGNTAKFYRHMLSLKNCIFSVSALRLPCAQ